MNKEEEEEDSTNIINTRRITNDSSDDDNKNRIGEEEEINQIWGTWEELILTSAVKRHGFSDWDTVAKEITSRSSLLATAGNCKLKYEDLRRRFAGDDGGDKYLDAAEEKLRRIRVAELRREVKRCDESILSLQSKVKKLEEEEKADLEETVKTKPVKLNESDRENKSVNESNSTPSVDKNVDHEALTGDKPVKENNPDPEDGTVSKGSGMSNSGELGESGTSGKRKRRKYRSVGGNGGDVKMAGDKSQPLIEIIKLIRSHPRGFVFESRLRCQETKEYKKVIRQHLDIKTIEKKLEKGSYVSSSLSFYKDIKLLFTNAIVFFPPSSSESVAAHELRVLVSNEIKKQTGKSGNGVVKAEAGTSGSKRKSSAAPLVVCKKRKTGAKKTSPPSSSSLKPKDEKKSKEESEEKTMTTTTTTTSTVARSSRRAKTDASNVVAKTGRGKKQAETKTESSNDDNDEEEDPKTEKKRALDKKKSVADFLKRIKTNSPQKVKETTSKKEGNVKKETTKPKPRELRSNSTGKKKVEEETNSKKTSSKRKQPSKKEAEEVPVVTGKRGRESGKDSNKQQPKKRTRR